MLVFNLRWNLWHVFYKFAILLLIKHYQDDCVSLADATNDSWDIDLTCHIYVCKRMFRNGRIFWSLHPSPPKKTNSILEMLDFVFRTSAVLQLGMLGIPIYRKYRYWNSYRYIGMTFLVIPIYRNFRYTEKLRYFGISVLPKFIDIIEIYRYTGVILTIATVIGA